MEPWTFGSHGLAPEAHGVSIQKMCHFQVPGWTAEGGERERDGEGEGKSYVKSLAIVHLEGKESSAFIIWRRTARLPGGRAGSTPNESTSRTSGENRLDASSGGRIVTTQPQEYPLSRMRTIPTRVD